MVDEDDGRSSGSEGGCVRRADRPPRSVLSKPRRQPSTFTTATPPAWEAEMDARFAKLTAQLAKMLQKGAPSNRRGHQVQCQSRRSCLAASPVSPATHAGKKGIYGGSPAARPARSGARRSLETSRGTAQFPKPKPCSQPGPATRDEGPDIQVTDTEMVATDEDPLKFDLQQLPVINQGVFKLLVLIKTDLQQPPLC